MHTARPAAPCGRQRARVDQRVPHEVGPDGSRKRPRNAQPRDLVPPARVPVRRPRREVELLRPLESLLCRLFRGHTHARGCVSMLLLSRPLCGGARQRREGGTDLLLGFVPRGRAVQAGPFEVREGHHPLLPGDLTVPVPVPAGGGADFERQRLAERAPGGRVRERGERPLAQLAEHGHAQTQRRRRLGAC